jgi:hypothetical protein
VPLMIMVCVRFRLNIMWKYKEQQSFTLTDEEYLERLDGVAAALVAWGKAEQVRGVLVLCVGCEGRPKQQAKTIALCILHKCHWPCQPVDCNRGSLLAIADNGCTWHSLASVLTHTRCIATAGQRGVHVRCACYKFSVVSSSRRDVLNIWAADCWISPPCADESNNTYYVLF